MRLFEVLRRWARNPQPRMEELRPFTRAEMDALADELGPLFGPLVVFAAETGLRTNEWVALERRDVDRDGRAVTVQRRCADGALTPYPKSTRSRRRVPLTAPALGALDSLPPQLSTMLLLPSTTGGYLDLHNWRYANGTRLSTRQGSSGAARTTCGTRSRPRPWRPVSRSSSWPG